MKGLVLWCSLMALIGRVDVMLRTGDCSQKEEEKAVCIDSPAWIDKCQAGLNASLWLFDPC